MKKPSKFPIYLHGVVAWLCLGMSVTGAYLRDGWLAWPFLASAIWMTAVAWLWYGEYGRRWAAYVHYREVHS